MATVLRHCRLVDQVDHVDIQIAEGRVIDIVSSQGPTDQPTPSEVDASGWRLAAGLIDLQVNGGWGHDLTEDPSSIWELGRHLLDVGVTAWLPTLVSASRQTRQQAIAVLEAGPPANWLGAEPLGWHFEGPFLNPARRGAHPESSIQPMPSSWADEPLPTLMTLAPELPGALAAIEHLTANGVVVSIGHTAASPQQVRTAIRSGASMGTHLFNAMTGLHHRTPGAAAGLLNSSAYLSIIADGHHVDDEMVQLVHSLASERIALVSDAMAALGMPEGTSRLGQRQVTVRDGAVRTADGGLAGSASSLLDCVHIYRRATGVSLAEAAAAASAAPARIIGDKGRGAVRQGARADFVVFDENDNHLCTFLAGSRIPAPGRD